MLPAQDLAGPPSKRAVLSLSFPLRRMARKYLPRRQKSNEMVKEELRTRHTEPNDVQHLLFVPSGTRCTELSPAWLRRSEAWGKGVEQYITPVQPALATLTPLAPWDHPPPSSVFCTSIQHLGSPAPVQPLLALGY